MLHKSFDMRFIHPSTHLIVGSVGAGKTFRIAEIIRQKKFLIRKGAKIKNVIICYSQWQKTYSDLQNEGLVTKFVNKLPSAFEFEELVKSHQGTGSLVFIDDFMSQINKDLVQIVTVLSRHTNTSTFLLMQSLFPPPSILSRQINLNCSYLHIFKNPRGRSSFTYLARQLLSSSYKWLIEAYEAATKEPYSCFLIDMTHNLDEKLRYRSNILPNEHPMKLYVQK